MPYMAPSSLVIPFEWLRVLHRLHEGGHAEAFIGGGALRDLDNNKPVKDVDIFIRDITFHRICNLLPHLALTDDTVHRGNYEDHFPEIDGVFNGTLNDGTLNDGSPPFNIISCDGPREHVSWLLHHMERFDLGICKIAYMRGLYKHDAYETDKANRTITICNPVRLSASISRAQRIRDRAYLGWRIVNPHPLAILDSPFDDSVMYGPPNEREGMEMEDL